MAQDSEQIKNELTNTAANPDSRGKQESIGLDDTVQRLTETGGPSGLEPTRYGDWERKGRCIDF